MSKSTAKRTRRKAYSPPPEEPSSTAQDSAKSLHLVPVVEFTPRHGSDTSIEPQGESTSAATPEPSHTVKAACESECMLGVNVNVSSPRSSGAVQPACPLDETIPTTPISTIPPSNSCAAMTPTGEPRIEQEIFELGADEKSAEAEVSRFQNPIVEQKVIHTKFKKQRDKNIEKARRVIACKDKTPHESSQPIGPASSLNETPAVDLAPEVPPAYSVSSIPPELLLPILAMVDTGWTPLRLVCKQWNSIILNNGHFWNDIVLTTRLDSANPGLHGDVPWHPRQLLCRSLLAVEEALKRSKSSPLSITFDFIDSVGEAPKRDKFGETSFGAGPHMIQRRQDAVKLVGKEISRIRTLSVFATGGIRSDTLLEGSFKPERAVELEKLYIKGRTYEASAEDARFSQLISAPKLQRLRFLDRPTKDLGPSTEVNWSGFVDISLGRLLLDWEDLVTPPPLSNLRILRLSAWPLDTLRILQTPCLESLVIYDWMYPFFEEDASPVDPVDVPSLRSLHLWRNFSMLEMLNIPTVTHIELQSDWENSRDNDSKWIANIFKGAERRFPNLTSLALCTCATSGFIIEGLAHLPHLLDLDVDAARKKLTSAFWDHLAQTVKGKEQTKTPNILPNLKRLHVRLYHEHLLKIQSLATKVKETREAVGRPLILFVVKWKGGGESNIVGERQQKLAPMFPRQRSV